MKSASFQVCDDMSCTSRKEQELKNDETWIVNVFCFLFLIFVRNQHDIRDEIIVYHCDCDYCCCCPIISHWTTVHGCCSFPGLLIYFIFQSHGTTNSINNNHGNNSNHNNNNNTNVADSKKEEYRKYLERTGVLDQLTKVLVGLYEEPERPTHPLDYVRRYLGAPTSIDVDGLKRENEELKRQLEKFQKQPK